MKPNLLAPAILTAAVAVLRAAEPPALTGFSPAAAATERTLEEKFKAIPSPELLKAAMQRLSARPHHVGSAYDKDNAEWILARFNEAGFDARIERFDVLFPTPRTRVLEMTAPISYKAALSEPPVDGDPTSAQSDEQLPVYNAYSTDGDVTGPLVYVNYGRPEDYEDLDRLGVSAKGAVVIARYGKCWRGVKPKVAAEHGAAGCIIYSDPRDDGYFVDAAYPKGPMRNSDGAQRGSVMDFPSTSPGDPTTPGYGSLPDAKRSPLGSLPGITRIPTLPIGYKDAKPLLEALAGRVVPEAWRGGLPITYHAGPGPATVHLQAAFNWDIKPLYNVIARVPGSTAPDEWVVRGNHHDAWVNGAEDPVSGLIALLEEARSVGALLKDGWKPRRTLVFCAWDGEEPGLLGSTEWGEAHAEELRRHAVAYLNTDGSNRGFMSVSGSHVLERFFNEVMADVEDPETHLTLWKRRQAGLLAASGATAAERKELRERRDLRLEALGSGSDYTVFIDHLGVASADLRFGGETEEGIYHSIYDDYAWYSRFSDGDFTYGRALAQTVGVSMLRLADAEVIPYEFAGLADTVHKYVEDLQALLKRKREEIEERNKQLEDGVFAAVNDPRKPKVAPPFEDPAPELNFAPLVNASHALTTAAQKYQKAFTHARPAFGEPRNAATLRELNATLLQSERTLLDPAGLPGRPWYRHLVYAPGVYSGYGAKTFPGVREGIELKHYPEAEKEISRAAAVIQAEADLVRNATKLLERLTP
jgi:N-acetylated-alpha-linked acidic dipeptidase